MAFPRIPLTWIANAAPQAQALREAAERHAIDRLCESITRPLPPEALSRLRDSLHAELAPSAGPSPGLIRYVSGTAVRRLAERLQQKNLGFFLDRQVRFVRLQGGKENDEAGRPVRMSVPETGPTLDVTLIAMDRALNEDQAVLETWFIPAYLAALTAAPRSPRAIAYQKLSPVERGLFENAGRVQLARPDLPPRDRETAQRVAGDALLRELGRAILVAFERDAFQGHRSARELLSTWQGELPALVQNGMERMRYDMEWVEWHVLGSGSPDQFMGHVLSSVFADQFLLFAEPDAIARRFLWEDTRALRGLVTQVLQHFVHKRAADVNPWTRWAGPS